MSHQSRLAHASCRLVPEDPARSRHHTRPAQQRSVLHQGVVPGAAWRDGQRSWVSHPSCSSTRTSMAPRSPGSACTLPPARAWPGCTSDPRRRCVSATTWPMTSFPPPDLDFARPCLPVTSAACRASRARVASTFAPDIVLTDLDQLPSCVTSGAARVAQATCRGTTPVGSACAVRAQLSG